MNSKSGLNVCGLVAAVLMMAACALYIVGAASKQYWVDQSNQGYKVSLGLYGYCVTYDYPLDFQNQCGDSSCNRANTNQPGSSYQNSFCEKYDAARALIVCAIILSGFASILILIDAVCAFTKRTNLFAMLTGVLAFFCGLISMAIGANIYQDTLKSAGYTFGLAFDTATAAWILNLFACCAYTLAY